MATRRRALGHQSLGDISRQILLELRAEFIASGRSADELQREYSGPSLPAMKMRYMQEQGHSEVDFDLALKELEDNHLVDTGPHPMYDNEPGSSVIVIAFFSRRAFVYLKEAGYRAAAQIALPKPLRAPPPRVHISGGTFHQSPIAFGDYATQLQSISTTSDTATAQRLLELLAQGGVKPGDGEKAEVALLVDKMSKGNVEEGKPLFKKVFGVVGEGVKAVAWGVLTELATKAMGL